MNYRLIVLTHGDSATLEECLDAFRDHVTPEPTSAYFHGDGMEPRAAAYDVVAVRSWPLITVGGPARPHGFCDAVSECWAEAVGSPGTGEHEYVYWLEHDFLHTRPVDLRDLAAVLDAQPRLAQMALMRNPVSPDEVAAGGVLESRPGQYEPREPSTCLECEGDLAWVTETRAGSERSMWACTTLGGCSKPEPPSPVWLWHRSYFTTTPSLMRRSFMAENPWPDYPSECEGRFGIDLIERGFTFGVWGSGEPWVEHIGERTGFGY